METVTSPTDTQKTSSSLLFCRACQAVYQQPKLLPCLHSFCRPCLVHAVTNESDGTFIICPLCSHKSQVPATGVVGVPDNLFLNRLCQVCIFFLTQNNFWSVQLLSRNNIVLIRWCLSRTPTPFFKSWLQNIAVLLCTKWLLIFCNHGLEERVGVLFQM